MRILVTGGTGLLGNNILRELQATGHELVALVRNAPDREVFDGIDCKFQEGDVIDRDAVANAVSNCDAVIHSAGLIQLGWSRVEESMRVNQIGTRYFVDSCIQGNCPFVYVGTVNTLAVGSKDSPSDEETPLDHAGGQTPCSYVLSKRAGVQETLDGVANGLQATIVHPGFMLGPWDWKPSSGRMMLEVGKRWQPIAPTGGCSVCDVRDVAAGTVRALMAICESEIPSGRQFILAGENLSYLELWRDFAKRMGVRGPMIKAGPLMRKLAGFAGDAMTAATGKESDLNSAAIKMSSQYHWHDSSRARRELGYTNRPLEQTLADAAGWLKSRFLRVDKKGPALVSKDSSENTAHQPMQDYSADEIDLVVSKK